MLIHPDAATFLSILKTCVRIGAADQGQLVHAQIIKFGFLGRDITVGTSLVHMYAKCGELAKAADVLYELPVWDVASWNALIGGYIEHGYDEEAVSCFDWMQHEGIFPDAVTFACILKACGSIGVATKGQEFHAQVVREHFLLKNIVVHNALISMYCKCGQFDKAQEVFDDVLLRDVVSWNTLIRGYAQLELGEEALGCLERMLCECVSPSAVTFACIVSVCGNLGALDKGQEIHAQIVQEGFVETEKVICNSLIDMYSRCGSLNEAEEVFGKLSGGDLLAWTMLIGAYTDHGHGEVALVCFQRMQSEGLSPNAITFVCALKACGSIGALERVHRLHALIIGGASFDKDIVVANTLVDTYGKCGLLAEAQRVFYEMRIQDVLSWNGLIAGFVQHGHGEEALTCFRGMQRDGLSPDPFTYACTVKACSNIGAIKEGQEMFIEIVRGGLLENDIVVGNALVDMFSKCGMMAEAQAVFEELPVLDIVSWNSLMQGYAQHGYGEEALCCFKQMRQDGFTPDAFTFVCIMKACGSLGSTHNGQEVHIEIVKHGLVERDIFVCTALLDMYAKFGMLVEARGVLNKLATQDVLSLNTLLAGHAQVGEDGFVLSCLGQMINEGQEPDLVTFTILLNACSHGGLIEIGQSYFEIISLVYAFLPTLEHYACLVDLFGRGGQLDRAIAVILEMPFFPNCDIWLTLLGACQKWGHLRIGRMALENVVELDDMDAAGYVCMINIYSSEACSQELSCIRENKDDRGHVKFVTEFNYSSHIVDYDDIMSY